MLSHKTMMILFGLMTVNGLLPSRSFAIFFMTGSVVVIFLERPFGS